MQLFCQDRLGTNTPRNAEKRDRFEFLYCCCVGLGPRVLRPQDGGAAGPHNRPRAARWCVLARKAGKHDTAVFGAHENEHLPRQARDKHMKDVLKNGRVFPSAERFMPDTLEKFTNAGVPMGLIAAHWLLPLFSMTLPPTTLYRLWDLLFLYGSKVLLCSALTYEEKTITHSSFFRCQLRV